MFNFTTLTIFNNIVKYDLASGREVPKNANLIVGKTSPTADTPKIRIGNVRFNADLIERFEAKKPTPESLASVTFDMTDIISAIPQDVNEVTARIALYVGLSISNLDFQYANALTYKGKPFYVEFYVKKTDTADQVATRVAANARKYNLFISDEKLLNITNDSHAATTEPQADAIGTVTFTAVNGYQLFKEAKLQIYDENAISIDCCSTSGEFKDVVVGVPVLWKLDDTGVAVPCDNSGDPLGDNPAITDYYKVSDDGTPTNLAATGEAPIMPGVEAFCDYNWIIHNLRLPTNEHTNFWTANRNEMPVVDGTYSQITVRMVTDRDGIAGGVVGQRATSVTTHVFYVLGDYNDSTTPSPAYKVYHELQVLASSKEVTNTNTAETALEKPFKGLPTQ